MAGREGRRRYIGGDGNGAKATAPIGRLAFPGGGASSVRTAHEVNSCHTKQCWVPRLWDVYSDRGAQPGVAVVHEEKTTARSGCATGSARLARDDNRNA